MSYQPCAEFHHPRGQGAAAWAWGSAAWGLAAWAWGSVAAERAAREVAAGIAPWGWAGVACAAEHGGHNDQHARVVRARTPPAAATRSGTYLGGGGLGGGLRRRFTRTIPGGARMALLLGGGGDAVGGGGDAFGGGGDAFGGGGDSAAACSNICSCQNGDTHATAASHPAIAGAVLRAHAAAAAANVAARTGGAPAAVAPRGARTCGWRRRNARAVTLVYWVAACGCGGAGAGRGGEEGGRAASDVRNRCRAHSPPSLSMLFKNDSHGPRVGGGGGAAGAACRPVPGGGGRAGEGVRSTGACRGLERRSPAAITAAGAHARPTCRTSKPQAGRGAHTRAPGLTACRARQQQRHQARSPHGGAGSSLAAHAGNAGWGVESFATNRLGGSTPGGWLRRAPDSSSATCSRQLELLPPRCFAVAGCPRFLDSCGPRQQCDRRRGTRRE